MSVNILYTFHTCNDYRNVEYSHAYRKFLALKITNLLHESKLREQNSGLDGSDKGKGRIYPTRSILRCNTSLRRAVVTVRAMESPCLLFFSYFRTDFHMDFYFKQSRLSSAASDPLSRIRIKAEAQLALYAGVYAITGGLGIQQSTLALLGLKGPYCAPLR